MMKQQQFHLLPWMVLVAVVVTGCHRPDSDPTATAPLVVKFDTVGSRVTIANAGTPTIWTLEPILEIGRAAIGGEAVPDEFGSVASVVGGSDGQVFVADELAAEVRVFDERGQLVRSFGGDGEGPGEFRRLISLGWLGDTLATLDARAARLGLFDTDGGWLGQRPYLPLGGENIRLYQTGRGELYMPFFRPSEDRGGMVFVRQTVAGPADTLPWTQDTFDHRNRVTCRHSGGQGISGYVSDLAPISLQVPAPGVMTAYAWTADYRISFVQDRDTVRVVLRDVPAEVLSEAEWRGEVEQFTAFRDTFDDEQCEPEGLPRPAVKSLIRAIFFDDLGRMWVERRDGEGFAFDVFGPAGRLVATMVAPNRSTRVIPTVNSDRVYLTRRDSLGIDYVSGYAIRPNG
ncbi:MAG: 6-bladed beta-propeller [Gemmatimonadetes bacterium]|nr:6-bladed beta-propeller [Gemmatimonadota bacterium]